MFVENNTKTQVVWRHTWKYTLDRNVLQGFLRKINCVCVVQNFCLFLCLYLTKLDTCLSRFWFFFFMWLLILSMCALVKKLSVKVFAHPSCGISRTKSKTAGHSFLQTPLIKCPLSSPDFCQVPQISFEWRTKTVNQALTGNHMNKSCLLEHISLVIRYTDLRSK